MKKLLLLGAFFVSAPFFAQVGIGTVTPNDKSALDIVSTEKGFLMPRMTTAQRIAIFPIADATSAGMRVYDTTTKTFWYYDGSQWIEDTKNASEPWFDGTTNLAATASSDSIYFPRGLMSIGTTVNDAKFHASATKAETDARRAMIGIETHWQSNNPNKFDSWNGFALMPTLPNPLNGFQPSNEPFIGYGPQTKSFTIQQFIDGPFGDIKETRMVFMPTGEAGIGYSASTLFGVTYPTSPKAALRVTNGTKTYDILNLDYDKTTVVKVDRTGNVGIGIATPLRKLHVSEAMRLQPQATAPASGALGDLYVNTDGKLYFHNGTAWKEVSLL